MTTLDKLDALLKAGLPRMEDDYDTVYVGSMSREQREMIQAAHEVLPALLAIARAVAAMPEWPSVLRQVNEGNESGDHFVSVDDYGPCLVCREQSKHAPDCAWVLARKLAGGT
jgi:hypothetical protein